MSTQRELNESSMRAMFDFTHSACCPNFIHSSPVSDLFPTHLSQSPDGKTVEFIDPPAGCPVGTRVMPVTYTGGTEPATPAQVKKKKILEAVLAAGLVTDADRVATFSGVKLVAGGEECKAPTLAGAAIS